MNQKTRQGTLSDAQLVLDSVRRIVRSLRNFSKQTEKEFDLSTAQIYVLQSLKERDRPLSVNGLAEATHTHQSSASVVIAKLVGRKLLSRAVDEDDSRSVRLSLSKQGEYLLSKSPISFQERLVRALAQMKPAERAGLIRGLQSLIEHAGLKDEVASMLMEEDDK